MPTINVNSTATLIAALKAAKDGDVILLAGGTYAGVLIRGLTKTGNITVQSADENNPAVLTDLVVRDSSGLTFRGLELATDSISGMYPFCVSGSKNIHLDNLNIHGTLNGNPSDDPGGLLFIRNSSGVTVSNSLFREARFALSHLDSENILITGNTFRDVRDDGIRGGGTSNITISNNYFTDFRPHLGDHPDAIQFWSAGETTSARNINIVNNVINRGDGGAIQGVFIRDNNLQLPFENVNIVGNVVIGGQYNGLTVMGARGVQIRDNLVVGQEGTESWIRVQSVTDAYITNNATTKLVISETQVAYQGGNVQLEYLSLAKAQEVGNWIDGLSPGSGSFLSHMATLRGYMSAQAVLDGSVVEQAAARQLYAFKEQLISGTEGSDRLTANRIGDFRLEGFGGSDLLTGGSSGTTLLVGGTGDDHYYVKSAGDFVIEEADEGHDTVHASIDVELPSNVEVLRLIAEGLTGRGNDLANRVVGSRGNDTIYSEGGADSVQGGGGADRIWGGSGSDHLAGEEGNDLIYGESGDDSLMGGLGDDVLDGGEGNDTLAGGNGADTLIGGSGADNYFYREGDIPLDADGSYETIVSFSSADGDKINLALLDAKSATTLNDKFTFIGTSAFHKVAGELRYEVQGGDSYVSGDVNGDGVADFVLRVVGMDTMAASDFML